MPYQIMPLGTNELFGQQLVGYGSDGLFLDVPYYSSVSPKSTSAFYLRSTAAAQQDGTYYNGRQGLALDYVEKYGSFDGKTNGTFNVMGLSRNDWGASWTHTEQFNNNLHGYFYVDIPEHNSLFASTNIVQQMRGYSVNVTATQTNTAAVYGYSSSQEDIDSYLQSSAHRLSGNQVHGLFYSTALTMNTSLVRSFVPYGPSSTQTVSTKSAGMNFFSSPLKLSNFSQLSDSFNLSQSSSNNTGATGVVANAVLTMSTRFSSTTNSTFTYSFSHDPVAENLQSGVTEPVALQPIVNQSNYSLSFNLAPKSNKWNSSITSSLSEPLGSSSFTAALNFFPTSIWTFGMDENFSQYAGLGYQDMELSLGRRIGSRELNFYWDSVDRRIRFDMGSAQF